jgi:short-subunit dehydrogenase
VNSRLRVEFLWIFSYLTVDGDRETAVSRIVSAENLAVLVNNAGFGTQGAFVDADLASQDHMHRLHILATLDLTHAALRNFKSKNTADAQHRGIINVSSVAAFGQAPFNVSYCATKAWINSFTKGLSMELSAEGSSVTVQALCPGFTHSEFHDVLGMDRRAIPEKFWMPARFVVSESLRGFDQGERIVIPGWRYRWIVRAMRVIPDSWMRWISISYARQRRKRAQALNG